MEPTPPAVNTVAPRGKAKTAGAALSDFLTAHAAQVTADRVTLGDIDEHLGRRSICVWLLVLALPMAFPIQIPGISVLFGIPLMVIAAQLLLGCRRAWLPPFLARRSVSRPDYVAMVARIEPTIRRLERLIRPRVPWLANSWVRYPVGLICCISAVIIILPIPLGHVVPGSAICLLALGLLEGDGIVVGMGFAISVLALALIGLASASIIDLTRDWFLG